MVISYMLKDIDQNYSIIFINSNRPLPIFECLAEDPNIFIRTKFVR